MNKNRFERVYDEDIVCIDHCAGSIKDSFKKGDYDRFINKLNQFQELSIKDLQEIESLKKENKELLNRLSKCTHDLGKELVLKEKLVDNINIELKKAEENYEFLFIQAKVYNSFKETSDKVVYFDSVFFIWRNYINALNSIKKELKLMDNGKIYSEGIGKLFELLVEEEVRRLLDEGYIHKSECPQAKEGEKIRLLKKANKSLQRKINELQLELNTIKMMR